MRQSHRLIWNSFIVWIMRVVRLFPEMILIPFIIHRLGEAEYGIFILAWSVFPILERICAGVGSALVRYSAGYFERGKTGAVNGLLSSACVLLGVWGLFGGAMILAGVNLYPHWLSFVSAEQAGELRFSLNIMALMVMLVFPLMPYAGILHAKQRYDLFSIVSTLFAYLRIGAIVGWFLLMEASLSALVIVSALGSVGSSIALTVLAYKYVPDLKMRLGLFNFQSVKRITKFGLMVLLDSFCMLINTSGVSWLMGLLESAAFVGLMAVILKPVHLVKEIINAMAVSIMPAASRYAALRNLTMLSELFLRSTRYIVLVVSVSLLFILFLSRPILFFWMGPDYQYLAPYICILCSGVALYMSSAAAEHVLRGLGHLRMTLMAVFLGSVVVTFGGLLLLNRLIDTPLSALAWGLGCGYCVTAVLRLFYARHVLGMQWFNLFWRCYGQLITIMTPLALIGYFFLKAFNIEQLLGRLAVTTCVAAVALVSFCMLFFAEDEKAMLRSVYAAVQYKLTTFMTP